ncbi:prohibitin protein Wph [Salpingoeca rosetta]|uniref:Prohibitin n=1 Tax=Salpingoeca rosetta (strain ATCC 50818 / BSB-021) TaxID=946362 RepID=F2UN90_SALR5|nr:prohibitin protein Wph [Salpingoeca rosetta]EGD78589.1 prohibitin protein Wph [Salpingoeca rosetta]|eukprot:XP_004989538.1 prohibitin protein Wph [Salpingoeca rosetta]
MAALLTRIGWIGAGIAFGGAVIQGALYDVDGGHRAVIFDQFRGVSEIVRPEGTHFMIPVVQRPIIYDVRSQPRNIPVTTPSKDLQNVNITLRILYRPEVKSLPWIFKNYGTDYAERVLPSIGHEILKAVVAQHDAAELITQREIVSMKCREALNSRARDFHIILDDISITHLTFGHEFTHAVELKQVAQQEAERARFLVERAEQEKIANIIRAEGDSKAAKLISNALQEHGTGLIELRKIEAAKDIAGTLSRSRNVAYLPGGKNLLLNMNV